MPHEAGRELDALVAEKVMGKHVEFVEQFGGYYEVGKPLPGTPYVLKDGREAHSIKPYSTDIAAAWEVLAHVAHLHQERGSPGGFIYKPVVRLEFYEHDDCYEVVIGRCKGIMGDVKHDKNYDDIVVRAMDPVPLEPRATAIQRAMALMICRAALKAVGVP